MESSDSFNVRVFLEGLFTIVFGVSILIKFSNPLWSNSNALFFNEKTMAHIHSYFYADRNLAKNTTLFLRICHKNK